MGTTRTAKGYFYYVALGLVAGLGALGATLNATAGSRTKIASTLAIEVGGCEARAAHQKVTAPGTVDTSEGGEGGAPAGFDFEIQGNGEHGVRNAHMTSPNTVEFDIWANGGGSMQTIPLIGSKCLNPTGANTAVNVYAYTE